MSKAGGKPASNVEELLALGVHSEAKGRERVGGRLSLRRRVLFLAAIMKDTAFVCRALGL